MNHGHIERAVVHFDDLDAMGVLHNSRYAVLLERALTAWWGRHGYSYSNGVPTKPDAFNVVVEYSISYKVPIRGTGEIGIHFWVERLGESSGTYGFRFLSADGSVVHAEGRRVNVKLDPHTLRPTPWTAEASALGASLSAAR
jgi:acyl-CoA thioester hydrolase